ncbi:MAG: trigger factor [Ruminococcaceae bacterium]|nr:trigger factor [Oscillospiraceae bacterium]
MSLTKKEMVEKNKYEIEFSIDKETFDDAVMKVYRKSVKNINVPGFRKGKAPKAIIEKMYGKGVFYEDAINDLLPAAYEDAAKASELEIVGNPEFDIVSIDDNGVVMKAVVYTKPDVSIKDYFGIEVTKTLAPVSDEEVDREIKTVQERNAREIEVTDRAAEMGDVAVIDFDGYVDDKQFDGGKAEGHSLKLGSGQFIPGFEEQIVGKNVGDSFDVNVKFPADYHAKELADKDAVFKCVLHKLEKEELPALDDEFAKDVSEFDTFAEYKADVKAKIEERHNRTADAEVEEQIIAALIEKLEADIPECMFEAETENFVRDYDSRLRMQGLDLGTYFKYTGMTLDNLREQMRPQAEKQVKTRLALEKIAELEGIVASDADINEEYENIAKAYGVTAEQAKENIPEDMIAADMKVKKAVDLVKEKAVVTDKAPEAKPAKKSTTTKSTTAKSTTTKSTTAKKTTSAKAAPKAEAEKTEEAPAEKPKRTRKPAAPKADTEPKAE